MKLLPAAPLAAVFEPTVLAQSQLVRLLKAPPSLGFGFGLSAHLIQVHMAIRLAFLVALIHEVTKCFEF